LKNEKEYGQDNILSIELVDVRKGMKPMKILEIMLYNVTSDVFVRQACEESQK
jgi:hypothetical protein